MKPISSGGSSKMFQNQVCWPNQTPSLVISEAFLVMVPSPFPTNLLDRPKKKSLLTLTLTNLQWSLFRVARISSKTDTSQNSLSTHHMAGWSDRRISLFLTQKHLITCLARPVIHPCAALSRWPVIDAHFSLTNLPSHDPCMTLNMVALAHCLLTGAHQICAFQPIDDQF